MVKTRGERALPFEALAEARIVARPGGDDLDCGELAGLDRLGEVHRPHCARTEKFTDSEATDDRSLRDCRHMRIVRLCSALLKSSDCRAQARVGSGWCPWNRGWGPFRAETGRSRCASGHPPRNR